MGPYLDHHRSTANGRVWFDDLKLIELPETEKLLFFLGIQKVDVYESIFDCKVSSVG